MPVVLPPVDPAAGTPSPRARLTFAIVAASAFIAVFAAGCSSAPPDEPATRSGRIDGMPPAHAERDASPQIPVADDEEYRQSARRAADALTSSLLRELTAKMRDEGARAAIEYCAVNARRLTDEVGRAHGVSLRRVTLRSRNPASVPDDREVRALRVFTELRDRSAIDANTEIVEVVTGENGRELLLLRPIVIRDPCLACHGDAAKLDPAVTAVLRERYPEDRATGYGRGDLRGAISVRVPMP